MFKPWTFDDCLHSTGSRNMAYVLVTSASEIYDAVSSFATAEYLVRVDHFSNVRCQILIVGQTLTQIVDEETNDYCRRVLLTK